MRVAVFGTGGVGGYFGARLATAGVDVVFIARGEHLRALRTSGLRVDSVLGDVLVHPAQATDCPAEVGRVDVVLLGVKTWQVPEVTDAIRPLIGPETCVVPLQNGVETPALLTDRLGAEHVVGGLCAAFSFIAGPGHIRHIGGPTVIKFGELDHRRTARVEQLRAAFERAGVAVEVPADIHVALWEKCVLVVPFGGLGALTRAPIGVLMRLPQTRTLIERGMEEVYHVARARKIPLADDIVTRSIAVLDTLPPSGTSSLQRDVAAGKRSELDAWTGAVVRLATEAGVPTPLHSFLYASLLPLELRARGEVTFPCEDRGAMSRYVDPTEQLVTEIVVKSVKISVQFYCSLGFHLLRDGGDFVELTWEDHRLFLAELSAFRGVDRAVWSPAPEFPVANVRVMVPDVDDHWRRANELGARIVIPIGDRYYGLRDFTIADPDGFGIRFASTLEQR